MSNSYKAERTFSGELLVGFDKDGNKVAVNVVKCNGPQHYLSAYLVKDGDVPDQTVSWKDIVTLIPLWSYLESKKPRTQMGHVWAYFIKYGDVKRAALCAKNDSKVVYNGDDSDAGSPGIGDSDIKNTVGHDGTSHHNDAAAHNDTTGADYDDTTGSASCKVKRKETLPDQADSCNISSDECDCKGQGIKRERSLEIEQVEAADLPLRMPGSYIPNFDEHLHGGNPEEVFSAEKPAKRLI